MKRLPYYAGCSLHSSASEYDRSLREAFRALDIELHELKEWACCGTSPRISLSNTLAVSLCAKNLLQVRKEGGSEVVVPCAACFSRFRTSQHEMAKSPATKAKVEKALGEEIGAPVSVYHPLAVLNTPEMLGAIRERVKVDMKGLKVVSYYGCLLTRPPKVTGFDSCENPMSMDRILSRAGFTVLDWSYKTECCGAALAMTRTDIALKLCRDILLDAAGVGADCIVTACPKCQGNLDTRQSEIDWNGKDGAHLPIVYFTQLLGLAFGIGKEKLGLGNHLTPTARVLQCIGK
jgi:heterodisulfide reductase subunit B